MNSPRKFWYTRGHLYRSLPTNDPSSQSVRGEGAHHKIFCELGSGCAHMDHRGQGARTWTTGVRVRAHGPPAPCSSSADAHCCLPRKASAFWGGLFDISCIYWLSNVVSRILCPEVSLRVNSPQKLWSCHPSSFFPKMQRSPYKMIISSCNSDGFP